MNSARKIMWCICLGVWLAVLLAIIPLGAMLSADWQNYAVVAHEEASAQRLEAATTRDTAALLERLRQASIYREVEETARWCAASHCKEALPLLRRIYYDENILYEDTWYGIPPFTSTFVAIRQLEGRPIDKLMLASATLKASLLSPPDFPLLLPSAAFFSRFTARQFILRCKDKEAAGFIAVLLARLNSKVPWGDPRDVRYAGRELLKKLPREASQPLLKRIRTRTGSDIRAEYREGIIAHGVREFDELYNICGTQSYTRSRSILDICILPFQFVLSLGIFYLWLVYLGARCLGDYRSQTAAALNEGNAVPRSLEARRCRAARCACLVAACWVPVAVRAWIMLAIAHRGIHGNIYLVLAYRNTYLDTILTLMLVSTPALLYEGRISRRLRSRERETELGAG